MLEYAENTLRCDVAAVIFSSKAGVAVDLLIRVTEVRGVALRPPTGVADLDFVVLAADALEACDVSRPRPANRSAVNRKLRSQRGARRGIRAAHIVRVRQRRNTR